MNQQLREILYYNPAEKKNAHLKKGLNEYKLLINALLHAIDHFHHRNLEKFDSLVGENACQIRAVKVAMLASDNLDLSQLKKEAQILLDKIDLLLQNETISKLISQDVSLEDVLNQNDLDLELTKNEMFLLQAFLLSEMKAPIEKTITSLVRLEKSSPKKLRQYGDATSSFSFNTARKLRRLLSQSSVEFVQELAWDLGDVSLINMVSDSYTYIHNDAWLCLPMFWTYEILLKSCLKKGIPLIIKAKFLKPLENAYQQIEEETIFFKPVKGSNDFSYLSSDPNEIDFAQPACVISGVVEIDNEDFCKIKWKDRILNNCILNVILAGAADHRQYPNPEIDIKLRESKFEKYIDFAKNEGFH